MKLAGLGNLLILGDSYSTFEGYVPRGFLSYYTTGSGAETKVRRVEETWWHRLISQMECNLVLNSSWSGSTICNTGYDGKDFSETSFVGRFDKLVAEGFFQKQSIDTVLVMGGTNDSWAKSPVGEPKWGNWEKADLRYVAPAACYLMHRIRLTLPESRVCFILNSGLSLEVTDCIKAACGHYGAEIIELTDMDKIEGHPTAEGMNKIAQQVIAHFIIKEM